LHRQVFPHYASNIHARNTTSRPCRKGAKTSRRAAASRAGRAWRQAHASLRVDVRAAAAMGEGGENEGRGESMAGERVHHGADATHPGPHVARARRRRRMA
jgi:hypothetical protein